MNGFTKMSDEKAAKTHGGAAWLAALAAVPVVAMAITSISNLIRSFTGSSGSDSGQIKTKDVDYKWENKIENKVTAKPSAATNPVKAPIYFGY